MAGKRKIRPVADDGLIARDNGVWGKDKLSFIDEFVPPALAATTAKRQRFYVDLFAGPGMNVDARGQGEQFVGAALRVLQMRSPRDPAVHFTDAVLVNLDPLDHQALQTRVDRLCEAGQCVLDRTRVRHIRDDANVVIPSILSRIHRQAYVFVLADMENPSQWPWSSVAALRSLGHKSIDLCMLFPLDMGINRLIPWATPANAPVLRTIYGNDRWEPIIGRRKTTPDGARMRKQLVDLYLDQLRELGWTYPRVTRHVKRGESHRLYEMLYATAHEAGDNIAGWSAKRGSPSRPPSLFDP